MQEENAIKEVFDEIDTSGDGKLDAGELKMAFRTLGLEFTTDELLKLVSEFDPDNTGSIDYESFFNLIHNSMTKKDPMDKIKLSFQMLDENKTGKITLANLKHVASQLGEDISEQELQEMINEADLDGDGKISYDEYLNMMLKTIY